MKYTDEELIEIIQKEKKGKHLMFLLERYKPLIYSRASHTHKLYKKSLLDFDDILRIFEYTFCSLVKKYDTTSIVKFAGYISFYLPNRVKDILRKELRTTKTIVGNDIEYNDHLSMFQKLDESDSIERATSKLEDLLLIIKGKNRLNPFSEKELDLINMLSEKKSAKEISENKKLNINQVYRDIYNVRIKIRNLVK